MAEWRELTEDDEQPQGTAPQTGGFALPVPQDPEFSELKESLFEEVKTGIQSAEDPRFARLRFGPRGAQGGTGGALPEEETPSEWRELEAPPPTPKETEPDSLWQKAINFTSRSIIEQAAGGAREFGQRMAFEEATERGEEFAQLQQLKDAPEGEGMVFGPTSLGDMFRSPFEALNIGENLLKTMASGSTEGRVALEGYLLGEAQKKLDRAKELGESAEDRPFSKATQQFLNPESENAAWDDFMADPFTIVAELGTRSLPNMAPGVALGIAGGAAAGQPGFVAGMGAGSARVEYAATIMGELQQQKIDIYDAKQLFEVISNNELMDEIHQKASTRAATIGTLDGIAGLVGATSLATPIKNQIARRFVEVAAQTGTQGGLGGLGEALAMTQTGEAETLGEAFGTRDVLAEIAGEAVTAPVEVTAATVAGVRDTVGGDVKADAEPAPGTGGDLDTPSTDIDPETGKPVIREDVAAETESFETPQEGFSDAERAALEDALDNQADESPAQGTLDLPPPPAPTPETATTPTAEKAPVAAGPEPSAAPELAVEDEVVTEEDLVTEPTPEVEAAPVESPMIQKKDVEAGFRTLAKKTKEGMPGIRKAIKNLGVAIAGVFPEAKNLPGLKGTVGPKRMGEYFAALDEEIKIDETLPNLKEFLQAVYDSPDAATAIQNINRLKDYVATSGAGVVDGGTTIAPTLAGAVQGITLYDTFEADRAAGVKKYTAKDKEGKPVERTTNRSAKNKPQARAVAIDELATVVTSLVKQATEAGIDVAGEINDLVARARSYRKSGEVATTVVSKGGAGSKKTSYKFNRKNLDEVGGKLREAAQTLVEQLSTVDKQVQTPTSITPKKTDGKPKVKKTSAVTEAPAKPKKAEAAKKTSKKRVSEREAKAGELSQQAERQREIDEELASDIAYEERTKPHKEQSTADWVRGYTRPGRKMGVTAGTTAAIEKNLQILEESGHPEAAMLRKQIEKTKFSELKTQEEKLAAGTEVKYKPSKWRMTVTPKDTKSVKQMDKAPIVGGFDTKQEAMAHARAIKKELGGTGTATIEVIKDPDFVAPTIEKKKAQAELAAALPGAAKLIKVEGDTSSPNVVPPAKLSEDDVVAGLLAMDPAELSYNNLRRVAKHMGVSAKGTKAAILERVQAADTKAAQKVEAALGEPKVKVTTKKKRRIADPDAVIEVAAPSISGRQLNKVEEEMGQTLDEAGISKKAAATIKALIKKADPEGQKKILTAISNYKGPEDNLNLVATIEAALKGQVSNSAMMDVLQFVEGMALKRMGLADPRELTADADLAEEAAAQGMSLEDYKTVLQETGQYVEDVDPEVQRGSDEFFDMSTDEYENSQWVRSNALPQGANTDSEQLFRALIKVKNGLLGFLSKYTKIRGLPDPGPTNVNDLLKAIIKSLPSNNRHVPLAKRLLELNLDVPVYIYGEQFEVNGEKALGSYYPGNEFSAADRKIRLYVGETTDPRHIFSTALHEIVHAATVAGYATDAGFKAEIDSLYDAAVAEMDRRVPHWRKAGINESGQFYGLRNAEEFMAEALTNPDFQHWLASIESIHTKAPWHQQTLKTFVSGLMRDFINAVKKHLGYSIRNSLLEDVLVMIDPLLQAETDVQVSQQKMHVKFKRAEESLEGLESILDASPRAKVDPKKKSRDQLLDSQRSLKKGVAAKAKELAQRLKQLGRKGNLGFSNRDVIERNRRALFETASKAMDMVNPLTAYTKAKNSASALARKYERMGFLMLKKMQALTNNARSELGTHMRDITKANIDPTQPLNSAANAHIWTKKGKIRKAFKDIAPLARSNYLNFKEANPKAAALLAEMATLTKQIHDTKVRSAMFALGEAFEFDTATTSKLQQAKTAADIDAIIPPDEVEIAATELANPTDDLFKGKKQTTKDLKAILSEAEARAVAAASAKKILTESSIKGWYFPLRRYGDFVVSSGPDVKTADRYVSFHSTQAEADSVAAALNAEAGPEGDQVSVSLKLRKSASAGDVKSVIGDLTARIKDKPTRARLKGAMAEVLASSAAYQSQLKRANVDGVAADDMARGFEEYVHVSKYTIGDLLVSHKVSTAIRDLNTLAKNEDGQFDTDTAVEIGQVVDEIKKQNITDVTDREMSTIQKTVGIVGFLNFLGAPSYWVLNATQTYTVTIPYITAKFGVKAPARLAAAQKQVLTAATKALNSKDKSYEGFKAQLTPGARRVVEALEAEGVIQSTIAHEFGDMLSPTALNKMREHAMLAPVAKTTELAMQVMEKVPEAVEHFNRISTALAIYELSNGDITATVDGVQATQFNYDTGNRARLLKNLPGVTSGTTKQYVTPIMMFKTYGIGIARLFYGAMLDVAFKQGGRTEAMKLAAGLITTHTFFGGVAGGIMMAPIMAIQAAANAMFKEPDDEWDLEEALDMWGQELAGDWFGTMVRKGVPTAVGIDMSRSVNLGNLIWMGNENLDPAKYGDIERGLFQLAGPVAQYGVTAYREGYRLLTGDNDGSLAEFAEAAIPLKVYRGISQAVRYNLKGIETGSDLNMLTPKEFTQTVQTAMGFQSVQKTGTQEAYYDDVRLEMKRSARKLQLMERANEAAAAGNISELSAIMKDIDTYNLSVPKAQYRVTAGEMARLRSRRRSTQREYDKKYRYSN